MSELSYAEAWESIVVGGGKRWAVLEHGTCVIFNHKTKDTAEDALIILKHFGPKLTQSGAKEFSVLKLTKVPGWCVTSPHPDILTYVHPGEILNDSPTDYEVGLHGVDKRIRDVQEPKVIATGKTE